MNLRLDTPSVTAHSVMESFRRFGWTDDMLANNMRCLLDIADDFRERRTNDLQLAIRVAHRNRALNRSVLENR